MNAEASANFAGHSAPAGGRIGPSLFLLIFVAAGLATIAFGIFSAVRGGAARRWPIVGCTITHSQVMANQRSDRPYLWTVGYTYQYGGRNYTANRYTANHPSTDDYVNEERLELQYPVGARTVCHVNPANPADAVLSSAGWWASLALIPFGSVFVLFGVIAIRGIWRSRVGASAVPARTPGVLAGLIFFLLFAVAGVAIGYFAFLRPTLRGREAINSWQRVPCTVLSSRVLSHSAEHGLTYNADVLYRYRVGGREYRSNHYDFLGGSSSGYEDKQRIVFRYPRGRQAICYVNPADPLDAVLEPHAASTPWWIALPVVFVAVGLGGIVSILRRSQGLKVIGDTSFPRQGMAEMGGGHMDFGTAMPQPTTVPVVLRQRRGPLVGFITAGLFALLFGGIFVFVLTQVLNGSIHAVGFLAVWLTFWGAATLGIGIVAVRSGLSLFNPRVELTLDHGTVSPGGTAGFQWTMTGRFDRVQRLTIRLEGREEATYRRGTTTSTDTHPFARIDLVDSTHNYEMQAGKGRLTIPAGSMHTFRSANNKVTWLLIVHGDIPNWPDVNGEYELPVPPAHAVPARAASVAEPPATAGGEPGLRLAGGRSNFSPGEVILGAASWSVQNTVRSVEIRLLWYTRGKGTVDGQIVDRVRFDDPASHDGRPFKFIAPDGPWSFSGKLISLIWAIEIVAEPKDRVQRVDIVIAPGGREILLPSLPPGGGVG